MTISRPNIILIDYENIQDVDLSLIQDKPINVVFFIGKLQKSVPMSLFKQALLFKNQIKIIESVGVGKNALDMQMATYAGQLSEKEPDAYIHFLSKDKGFDIVVDYFKKEKCLAARSNSFTALPFFRDDLALLPAKEREKKIIERLNNTRLANRPRKLKTLKTWMQAQLGSETNSNAVNNLINNLQQAGRIVLGESEKITYKI